MAVTVFVALLRGINVGGRATLPMAELRRAAEGCGLQDVQTYIQSGNVVGRSTAAASDVATTLRGAIRELGGVDPAVALRARAEWAQVVAGNPYVDRADDDKQLHVAFAVDGVTFTADPELDAAAFAPEELTVRSQETYLYLPNGMGRSRLAETFNRRGRGKDFTVRNWRTVRKLLSMADDLAASGRN